ncbi:transcription elongation factor GreA [Aurantimonas sp. Leaf443]|uniref:transcription elongation factor GreA n=1 Tax=Aurantimonas sp. Leaf443 TaxID=1736378 RepID=UPI0006FB73BD|nr:transcription elongation factor GreA [Aurantimonas sp. Leaf443]KQT88447.1 transcription elongation factor [Aurantimonas sp. Leaf443]
MSVAFVKEPNDSQVEVLPDRELGEDPNIVTETGMALIDGEVARLEAELETARAADDKIAMATIARDLRYWRARHATAEVTAAPSEPTSVQFGCRVELERDDGRRQTFRIVGIDEADPTKGLLSYLAPISRALMGKEVGDEVTAGTGKAEIVEIAAD